jgi:uncharacterized protein YciI
MSSVEVTPTTNLFVYKLIPPRKSFFADATDSERAIMQRHIEYWSGLMQQGFVLAFGPVADSSGSWGLGLVYADDADAVRALGHADPAVTSGLATAEVAPIPTGMLSATVTRGLRPAPAAKAVQESHETFIRR